MYMYIYTSISIYLWHHGENTFSLSECISMFMLPWRKRIQGAAGEAVFALSFARFSEYIYKYNMQLIYSHIQIHL